MVLVVEAVPQMNALVPILLVIAGEGGQNSQFDPRCIPVFLHRSNHLDRAFRTLRTVIGFHHLAERALSQQLGDAI